MVKVSPLADGRAGQRSPCDVARRGDERPMGDRPNGFIGSSEGRSDVQVYVAIGRR